MMDKNLWVTAPIESKTDLEHVRGHTIPEYIRDNCERMGWHDVIAFESAETGKKYTQHQILENSRAFAAQLIKLGPELDLRRTDVVGVVLPNIPEYAAVLFGIWEAGLVATPINPSCVEYEINQQLKATRSKLIITSSQFLSVTRAIKGKNSNIKNIIILDTDSSEIHDGDDCLNYFDMLETDSKGVDFFTGSQMTTENDIALLPFSSGTSGHSKGVMLTHYSMLSNVYLLTFPEICPAKKFEGGNTQERVIAVLPFFHIYGFSVTAVMNMLQGVHVVTMSSFNPTIFIQLLRDFKPTVLHLVPTLVSFISNSNKIGSSELETVRTILCGAATAGEVLIKKLLDKAKNATFLEGYGMTELSPAATISRFQKIGSIGKPLPEITIKITDIITGATLGKGERGEICVKSPSVMKGYLNNEEATRECIDDDGWLHTGDIGYYDEEDCFFVVDRLKELIKVKGFQVAPSELEDLIRSHEKVADVGVIGIPDDVSGEVPRAYVVAKDNNELTELDIIGFVQNKVSSYKRLRGGVQLVEEIPKGASGKILRRVLKENYAARALELS